MAELPHVAVCIPTYNQAAYLLSAIESALDQVDVETHLWISDDASSDNTSQLLDRYSLNPRVTIIRNLCNLGIAKNAGQVMLMAEQDFIVRLDSDDILRRNYCIEQLSLLDQYPDAAVAHCAVEQINEAGLSTSVRRLARKTGYQDSSTALKDSIHGYKVSANICMFRRQALSTLPFLYDPSLVFAEDWDLYVRLADLEWGNVYNSKVLASYRVWSDPVGVRSGRKAAELKGITHVLSASIASAWSARGWSLDAIDAARKRFARVHSSAIAADSCELHEREALIKLIDQLAGRDSTSLMGTSLPHFLSPTTLGLDLFQRKFKIWVKNLLY